MMYWVRKYGSDVGWSSESQKKIYNFVYAYLLYNSDIKSVFDVGAGDGSFGKFILNRIPDLEV